jgi:hypothetical protein
MTPTQPIIFELLLKTFYVKVCSVKELKFVVNAIGVPSAWNSLYDDWAEDDGFEFKDEYIIGIIRNNSHFGYEAVDGKNQLAGYGTLLTFKEFKYITKITRTFIKIQQEITGTYSRKQIFFNVIENFEDVFR